MSETINTNLETAEIKPYTLRGISAEDIFPMINILRKIGFKEIKSCFSDDVVKNIIKDVMDIFKSRSNTGEGDNEEAENTDNGDNANSKYVALGLSVLPTAMDVVDIILGNISKCETDIYKFLASLSGKTVDEIKKLPLVTFTEMIFDFVEKDEFKDFIKVVSKRFK